jgi:hypothetical protein
MVKRMVVRVACGLGGDVEFLPCAVECELKGVALCVERRESLCVCTQCLDVVIH